MNSLSEETIIKLDDFSFIFRYQIAKSRKLTNVFMEDCTFIWVIDALTKEKYEKQYIGKNN